jgi:hypothetical protein
LNIRPGRVTPRQTSKVDPQAQKQQHATLPAPTRGWIANENLALAQPAGAQVLENWFPTETNIRVRGGSSKYATVGAYTFSRASTATYRNASGIITTAQINEIRKQDGSFLIEAAATNLAIRSQEFDNAAWTKTRSSVTANSTTAPDNTSTADTLVEDATATSTHQTSMGITPTTGVTYTFSVYLKKKERTFAAIQFGNFANQVASNVVVADLTAGTINATDLSRSSITNIGNGWFRVSTTVTSLNGGGISPTISISTTAFSSGATYSGDGVSGIYVWGAQVEVGTAPSSYIPTTSATVTRAADVYDPTATTPALRMWNYKSGLVEKLFASTATGIYNISSVADADIIPTPDVTGQTSGYYSTAQISNAAGNYYLYAVNGTDKAQLYNGSTWTAIDGASTPAITGVTTSTLSFVWTYASKLFFVQKNTLSAWYLPVNSIGGAAQEINLAGIFQNGGSLLFGGKWSLDAGNGLDDKCVFVTTTGEVAIYQGTDPSDATNWQKVGVYQITPPMGANATMSAGGDLLIATEDGIVPISQAVNKDAAALSLAAVTVKIEPEWKTEVIARRSLPWEIMKWPEFNMMVVSLPVPDNVIQPYCFVANLQTGAWAKYTNWDTRCIGHYAGYGYFGTTDGKIMQMEVGGNDNGSPYVCTYVGMPEHLQLPGVTKTVHNARSVFRSAVPFIAKVSASTDYTISLPSAPPSVTNFTTDEWDSALWDVGKWDSGSTPTTTTKWVSIGKTGFSVAPQIQVTCGVTPYPRTELIAYDVIYEAGGVFV